MHPRKFATAIVFAGLLFGGATQARSVTPGPTTNGINAAPLVSNLDGDIVNYAAGQGAQFLDVGGDATIAVVDSADFSNGNLTAVVDANFYPGEDTLGIASTGAISLAGSSVKHGPITFGIFAWEPEEVACE